MPMVARHPDRQRGVAIAIVLWFIAAMSLLVAGIVHQGRMDLKLAQIHVAKAKVAAAGDGAVQLMMERFTSAPLDAGDQQRGKLPLAGRFRLGDTPVQVRMVPSSGLLDVFNSPPQVLAALFAYRGGLSAAQAKQLADNVIELRAPVLGRRGMRGSSTARLSTAEDLLRVPGFTRTLLDAISNDIRALRDGDGGRNRLNWAAMPEDLLSAVSSGNPGRAAAIAGRRNASDSRLWNPREETLYRVDAVVQYGDQPWLRRLWVKVSPGGQSELPWYVVRTEAPRVES